MDITPLFVRHALVTCNAYIVELSVALGTGFYIAQLRKACLQLQLSPCRNSIDQGAIQ